METMTNTTAKGRKVAPQLPATIDAATGELLPHTPAKSAHKRIRLTTIDDVNRELQRVYREARNRQIPVDLASKLTYILRTLAEVHMVAAFKQRLAALESQLGQRGADPMLIDDEVTR